MYPYKVVYLESSTLKKTSENLKKGNLDGLTTSIELEALLIEQKNNGFELQNLTPVSGSIIGSTSTINTTIGFMVTFIKMEK